jgi:hypothetical protein
MSNTPSLLMTVGEQFYKLHEFISEAETIGISKRIPLTAIPIDMVKAISKVFVAHPKAIVKVTAPGKTLQDLAYSLAELKYLSMVELAHLVELDRPFWTGEKLASYDFVPASMLDITVALSKTNSAECKELEKKYGLEYVMGIFGWSHFTGLQLVMAPNETELPDNLKHLQPLIDNGTIEPVHVIYRDDTKEGEIDE